MKQELHRPLGLEDDHLGFSFCLCHILVLECVVKKDKDFREASFL